MSDPLVDMFEESDAKHKAEIARLQRRVEELEGAIIAIWDAIPLSVSREKIDGAKGEVLARIVAAFRIAKEGKK